MSGLLDTKQYFLALASHNILARIKHNSLSTEAAWPRRHHPSGGYLWTVIELKRRSEYIGDAG